MRSCQPLSNECLSHAYEFQIQRSVSAGRTPQSIQCAIKEFGFSRSETVQWERVPCAKICVGRLHTHHGKRRGRRSLSQGWLGGTTKRDSRKLNVTILLGFWIQNWTFYFCRRKSTQASRLIACSTPSMLPIYWNISSVNYPSPWCRRAIFKNPFYDACCAKERRNVACRQLKWCVSCYRPSIWIRSSTSCSFWISCHCIRPWIECQSRIWQSYWHPD